MVRRHQDTGLALAIGIVSGFIGWAIQMPLPWMLGPMIGTTLAALVGLPVRGPGKLRPYVVPVIGVLLGSAITPDLFDRLGTWTLTILLLPLFLALAAAVSFVIYRRLGRYDPVTAFYSAMPGGLNEMLILGEAAGGDARKIALAHAARILIVVTLVVIYFGYVLDVKSGADGNGVVPLDMITPKNGIILLACAVIGVFAGKRLRLPAATIFGPMILSGWVHLMGWVEIAPPTLLVIIAQIVIGTVIGARFVGSTPRQIARDLGVAAVASGAMLVVALGCAELIAYSQGIPLSQAFLAYSPGGLTEMSLLTLALGQDIAYVSVMHIVRIALVIAVAPATSRLILRRMS
ncbi:AbrB family transcriptional regulator [Loktanella sp. SALINAS62]|uniref:AbrB family transcriptional regulator n=1 Tax=Loktanella sp. SALINAS62 TaxID=2706124 RepID=UPI001B8B9F8C|nr:AbrB family transcriptional regulator [Loktanella sp. SALINAS62]MBS1302351.1 AbrB family transcriptional regulator [Loktanella sp. SALINAS62]